MCNELVTDIIIKNYRKLCKYKTDGCLFLYLKFFGFFFPISTQKLYKTTKIKTAKGSFRKTCYTLMVFGCSPPKEKKVIYDVFLMILHFFISLGI